MSDYSDFPPLAQLKSVLKSAPRAAELFINLWKIKNSSQFHRPIVIRKNDAQKRTYLSKTMLRNHLLCIAQLGLLQFDETPESFIIRGLVHDKAK